MEGDPFDQPIRGGYTLFEIYGINWEDTCPSFAEMGHECNYLNSCEAFVISRFSLVSGKPLMEPEGTDMGFDQPLEYGDAALAVLRLLRELLRSGSGHNGDGSDKLCSAATGLGRSAPGGDIKQRDSSGIYRHRLLCLQRGG
ncbi:MAG: hypothetical protein V8T45_01850 [Oscillospiraceae bacterium]